MISGEKLFFILTVYLVFSFFEGAAQENTKYSGNPVFKGWYAEPEGILFGNEYWIYPTMSTYF